MKTKTSIMLVAAVCGLFIVTSPAFGQGTAFTYQGRLNDGGAVANGSYDLSFKLFDAASLQQGSTLTSTATPVTNGLFTLTLDFGNQFPGAARWLEIAVRTNGNGSFIALAPRQALTPVPYAVTAGNVTGPVPAAQLNGMVPSASLTGTYSSAVTLNNGGNSFSGDGSGLLNLNAGLLDGLSASQFWKLAGNGGTTAGVNFVGTTDNQPLELKANSQRALRLEPNVAAGAPNVVGGSYVNYVKPGTVGAHIGGGGATNYFQIEPALGGYYSVISNEVASDFGTIGGGGNNLIQSNSTLATIGGGSYNTIQTEARNSTIAGGLFNTIQTNGAFSAIGAGLGNTVSGAGSFIGGGGYDSLIGFFGGNTINADASFIGGGYENQIFTGSDFSVIAGGYYNTIGIGDGFYSVNAFGCTIGGGELNTNIGEFATIPGGYKNYAAGYSSFAAGQGAKAVHDGTFVWADDSTTTPFASTAANQFLIRASGGVVLQTSSLRFPGAGADTSTPVFTHKAIAANISGNKTYINNPVCNGQPNAILIITENWHAGDNVGNSKVVGVYYDAGAGQWAIFVDDGTAMPVGVAYNVMVTLP